MIILIKCVFLAKCCAFLGRRFYKSLIVTFTIIRNRTKVVNSLIDNLNRHETEKNQKKRKIATCEGAQRPNLLGVGSGGGFPLPQKILQI